MRFIYTKTFLKFFLIFVLVSLLVISNATGWLSGVKNAFLNVYGSATTTVASASVWTKNFLSVLFTIKNLARENALLEQKIDELSFENARLKSAKEENLALRRALKLTEQSKLNLLPAEIKFSDPTGFSQTIVINKGQDDGVKQGLPIIASPGLLVGKVSQVYGSTSEITLITDPSVLINAEVADTGAKGLIRGEHGLGLIFDLVTQNEVIKAQDLLITSGLTEDFPRGLLIGEIVSIRSSGSELFQKAFVTPAADLRNLKFLSVVL